MDAAWEGLGFLSLTVGALVAIFSFLAPVGTWAPRSEPAAAASFGASGLGYGDFGDLGDLDYRGLHSQHSRLWGEQLGAAADAAALDDDLLLFKPPAPDFYPEQYPADHHFSAGLLGTFVGFLSNLLGLVLIAGVFYLAYHSFSGDWATSRGYPEQRQQPQQAQSQQQQQQHQQQHQAQHHQQQPAFGISSQAQETYAAYGPELSRVTPALLTFVQMHIIRPLLNQLATSDAMWQQALASQGWELTAGPSSNTAASSGFQFPSQNGLYHQQQMHQQQQRQVSLLDARLPSPLCDDMHAASLWEERQQLERFLFSPSFEVSAAHRSHVFARLQLWARQGIFCDHTERSCGVIPTDGHILENLMIRWLDQRCGFTARFLPSGGSALRRVAQASPPFSMANGGGGGGGGGVNSSLGNGGAWPSGNSVLLRQVSNQLLSVKPQPEYELEALGRSWRFAQSPTNFLEAIALLLILHVADDFLPPLLVQTAEVGQLLGGIGRFLQMLPLPLLELLQSLRSSCSRRQRPPWGSSSSSSSGSSTGTFGSYQAAAAASSPFGAASSSSSSTLPFSAATAPAFPQPSAPPLLQPQAETGKFGHFAGPFGSSGWAAAATTAAPSSSSSSIPGKGPLQFFDADEHHRSPTSNSMEVDRGGCFGGSGFGEGLFSSRGSAGAAAARSPPPAPASSPVSAAGSDTGGAFGAFGGAGFSSSLGLGSSTFGQAPASAFSGSSFGAQQQQQQQHDFSAAGVGVWGSRSRSAGFEAQSLFAGFGMGEGLGSFAPTTSENVDMSPAGW